MPKTIRVKLKGVYSCPLPDGGNVSGKSGDVIDVPEHNANALLAGEYAELVSEPAVEAATPATTSGEPPAVIDTDAAEEPASDTDSTPAEDAATDGTDAETTPTPAEASPPATKPTPAGGPPAGGRKPIKLGAK